MHFLITGITGFVGSRMAEYALAQGAQYSARPGGEARPRTSNTSAQRSN